MKIMMLLIGHDFPPDIRVEKEARALLAAGHQVLLVCENRRGGPDRESWDGVQIIRLPALPLRLRQLNTAIFFTTLHSPLWERTVRRIVLAEAPDVLHVHDLPFVGPGLRIARRSGLPLVADLHENFPALIHIRNLRYQHNPANQFIFNPPRLARYERRVLPRCDAVIVVVEEAAERVKRLGVKAEKTSVVGNTEDIDAVESEETEALERPDSDMILAYVGGFGPHRGLETVIEAMPAIIEQIPSAQLVIVGDGRDRASLQQLARRLDVAQAVRFEGKQPFSKVHSYIQASDVCLVPHQSNPHTDSTMPHKLFQYMYMGKPVIVSNAIPLARVTQETGAGLVFRSGDSTSLANCVIELGDGTLREHLGEQGHKAVMERYNWKHDSQVLTELYQNLSRRQAPD